MSDFFLKCCTWEPEYINEYGSNLYLNNSGFTRFYRVYHYDLIKCKDPSRPESLTKLPKSNVQLVPQWCKLMPDQPFDSFLTLGEF